MSPVIFILLLALGMASVVCLAVWRNRRAADPRYRSAKHKLWEYELTEMEMEFRIAYRQQDYRKMNTLRDRIGRHLIEEPPE